MTGSNVWMGLTVPNNPIGAIPFIGSAYTPTADPLNFTWDFTNFRLNVAINGDTTGTDSINLYKQIDAYLPNGSINTALVGAYPAHTVSTSRGSGLVPLINLTADFLGGFEGYSYTGVVPAYTLSTAIWMYAKGASANNLGGEMHFITKADNGLMVDRITLDNAGNLLPTTNASASLGKALFGWSQINLDYTISGVVGAVVMNKPVGRVNIAAGAASIVVTNNKVTANSIVIAQLAGADGTLTFIKFVTAAAGQFTITGNANATGNTACNFIVINTDS